MRLALDLDIAFENLRQHRRRTLWLGGLLAAVTCALGLTLGAVRGVHDAMLATSITLFSGHLNVSGFYKTSAGRSAPVVRDAHAVTRAVLAAVPEAEGVVERGRGWGRLVSTTASRQIAVAGIDTAHDARWARAMELVAGRLEDMERPDAILLFESQARELGVGVGDPLTMSGTNYEGSSSALDLEVVAIARDMGFFSRFITFASWRAVDRFYALAPEVGGMLQVRLRDEHVARAEQLAARLRRALVAAGYAVTPPSAKPYFVKNEEAKDEDWTGQELDVNTWKDEVQFANWVLTVVDALGGGLVLVLLAVIMIGITSTMWIAIRERRREIGTLRALGMQRGHVLWVFVLETLLLSLASSALGAGCAALVAQTINGMTIPVPEFAQLVLMSNALRLSLDLEASLAACATVTVAVVLAAVWPSMRASRIRPSVAMHHFG